MQGYHLMRDHLLPLLVSDHGRENAGEVEINLCDNGMDVVLRLDAPLSRAEMTALIAATGSDEASSIARLSLMLSDDEPELVFQRDTPVMVWPMPDGASRDQLIFAPPAGGFMQSVADAETIMRQDCFDALQGMNKVVDLFSGAGSLGLALAFAAPAPKQIAAYDVSASAISALQSMIRSAAPDLPLHLTAKTRNLFQDPLSLSELRAFDGAIVDPPRSGAGRQMPLLAASGMQCVVMVSCDIKSFARDAEMLISAGYKCRWARHIDQFLLTPHSELVACFER
jgi:23S rRNA (uracil1939-C5)-methyltransferase